MIMAYDQALAQRVRGLLSRRRGLVERKMFGGVAFMIHGNMACGVLDDDLILRLGPDAPKALRRAHAKPFTVTGRAMRGFVVVTSQGSRTQAMLKGWVLKAAEFAARLPPK
jgi:TfoX/Sxy family transcriptional regulator of competence genes